MSKKLTFAQKFAEILLKQGAINSKEAEDFKKKFTESSSESFEAFLLDANLVPKIVLMKALATYYQVPYFDVMGYLFEHELLREFPKDVMMRNHFIPITIDEDIMVIAAAEPDDEDLLVKIGKFVNNDIRFNVSFAKDIQDVVEQFYDESITTVGNADDPYYEWVEREDLREKSLEEEEDKE